MKKHFARLFLPLGVLCAAAAFALLPYTGCGRSQTRDWILCGYFDPLPFPFYGALCVCRKIRAGCFHG